MEAVGKLPAPTGEPYLSKAFTIKLLGETELARPGRKVLDGWNAVLQLSPGNSHVTKNRVIQPL